ncbi:MAG: AAA family ATPase, partial [Nitrospirota bacterium]|nr:AAA family ATPase [Nitrospirota bacterium]
MYCEAFNLREKPFSLAADPRYLYMSQQHWEAMAHLMYGVEDDWGFVLITGEIGTGKTTLCRLLLEQMPSDVEFAFLMNPKLTVQELLASICDEFRIEHPPAEAGTRELSDLISAHLLDIHARAHKALLIIDEAQYLSSDVIDQLRLLTNLETVDGKLLRIILIGQPELRDKLAQPELEQMSQRITARYHLGPLSRKDV